MDDSSATKADPFRASLLGGICAAAVVLAFLGLHYGLHWTARFTAPIAPLVPTQQIMRPLAGAAIPLGLAIGLGAGVLRRRRYGVLTAAGIAGYVAASVIVTVWLAPEALGRHGTLHWIAQGAWAALTYAIVAGPPLVVALIVLERLTRVPEATAGGGDEAANGEAPGAEPADDESAAPSEAEDAAPATPAVAPNDEPAEPASRGSDELPPDAAVAPDDAPPSSPRRPQ